MSSGTAYQWVIGCIGLLIIGSILYYTTSNGSFGEAQKVFRHEPTEIELDLSDEQQQGGVEQPVAQEGGDSYQ